MIKFSRISHKILEDNGRRLEVDSKSFGSEIVRDWFSNFLLGSFVVG